MARPAVLSRYLKAMLSNVIHAGGKSPVTSGIQIILPKNIIFHGVYMIVTQNVTNMIHTNNRKNIVYVYTFYLTIILTTLLVGCTMDNEKKALDGNLKQLFEHPAELSKKSSYSNIVVNQRLVKNYHIDNEKYQNFHFENSDVHGLFIENATLSNSSFKSVSYADIFFSNSTLTNVTFENINFIDAIFTGAKLVNVTFKNCKIIDSLFSDIKGKVTYMNTEIDSVKFRDSRAALKFINSKIHNTTNPRIKIFNALKDGTSIDMFDTTLTDATVSGTLTHFKAKGGAIIDTGLGDTISDVILDDVTLDMSMGGTINNLRVVNSTIKRLAIGENINTVNISDCKMANVIAMISTKIDNVNLEDCSMKQFLPIKSQLRHFSLRDSNITMADFHNSYFHDFDVSNVVFNEINIEDTLAANTNINKLRFSGDHTVKDTGSNIKLH
jgi:uncharacterized protein YjbI with pentapeptide repeats